MGVKTALDQILNTEYIRELPQVPDGMINIGHPLQEAKVADGSFQVVGLTNRRVACSIVP
jgi:hypothetical protein